MNTKPVELVIPFFGEWDLSSLLNKLEVKSVKIIGIILQQNAKSGAKVFNNWFNIDTPNNSFVILNHNQKTLIFRELKPCIPLEFFNRKFQINNHNVVIPANDKISYDKSMNLKLSCSFNPDSFKFNLKKGDKFIGIVVKFSTTDEAIEVV